MGRLIDAKILFEKICDMEELARKLVLNIPKGSPDYMRYLERLNERIEFRYMVFDAPKAYDVDEVVKELEKMKPDIECFDDVEDFEYALKRHNKYIEIVKKGGVK